MAYENHLIDKRVVDRNITKGLVDPQNLKQQIEALPDREANCVRVSVEGDVEDSIDDLPDDDEDDEDMADDEGEG
ncbi:MAG: hypothetical protein QM778_31490 [Myxococcales bacterium]